MSSSVPSRAAITASAAGTEAPPESGARATSSRDGTGHRGGVRGELGLACLRGQRQGKWQLGGLDDATHQVGDPRDAEEPERVVDADGVGADAGELLGHRDDPVGVVARRVRVDDGRLHLASAGTRGLHGSAQVAHVVERVVDAEPIDAGIGGHLDERVDDVVTDVAMAGQRLAPQRRDQRARGRRLADGAQLLEGVLAEEAQRRLEGGAAEDVQRREAAAVQGVSHRDGMAAAQAAQQQRLLSGPQRAFDEFQSGHEGRLWTVRGTRSGGRNARRPAGASGSSSRTR